MRRRMPSALRRRLILPGLLSVAAGCTSTSQAVLTPAPVTVRAQAPEAAEPAQPKVLPINLDTLFRLAEEQNARIAQARARVDEATTEKGIADTCWLPDVFVGASYWRHEGGIQDQDGRFINSSFGSLFAGLEVTGRLDLKQATFERVNAERKVWQERGELSKVTSETLLDATQTYVDLLAARTGEAIVAEQQKELQDLLERSEKLAGVESGARVEVSRLRTELTARRQFTSRLRQQAAAASAKLAYLLGLDPQTVLVPVDGKLTPLDLVDVSQPVEQLIARATTTGPGVRELDGLINLIHESIAQANSRARLVPVVEVRMAEGAFGAGPGASSTWDNRWDLGLQVRWNLTDLIGRCDKQRLADLKLHQAQLAQQDLRGKLTLGVQESRETIVAGREQIPLGQQQIDQAREAFRLSDERLRKVLEHSSAGEVLLGLQSVALAQANYLNTVRDFNKAQLRLLVLLGPGPGAGCAPSPTAAGEK
jgi:outer membrane protein TolC